MFKKFSIIILGLSLILITSAPLYAVDTIETFDPGASDFEFYAGFEGIGLDKYQKGISTEIALGYGLIENFSAIVGVAASSNEYFNNGEAELGLGIFGTPLDTDHFDLDLKLNAAIGGTGLTNFSLTPGLELNFDLKPDMALWGMYLIIDESLSGRDESVEDDPTTPNVDESNEKYVFAPVTVVAIGTYYTIAEKHQLLLQFDSEILNNPASGEDTFILGGIALGYNVVLNDYIELINEVSFDIPQSGEDFSAGINIGIVVSLPDKF